jgi:hypothetical protein
LGLCFLFTSGVFSNSCFFLGGGGGVNLKRKKNLWSSFYSIYYELLIMEALAKLSFNFRNLSIQYNI